MAQNTNHQMRLISKDHEISFIQNERVDFEILLCESRCELCLGPRAVEIRAFVRNIRAISKGFEPHGANFKSG